MSVEKRTHEARRWLNRAKADLEAAGDESYVPTRYPDGLPDLIPAEMYTETEAGEAIAAASLIVTTAAGLL